MTKKFSAAIAAIALVGAGVVGAAETRSAQAIPMTSAAGAAVVGSVVLQGKTCSVATRTVGGSAVGVAVKGLKSGNCTCTVSSASPLSASAAAAKCQEGVTARGAMANNNFAVLFGVGALVAVPLVVKGSSPK